MNKTDKQTWIEKIEDKQVELFKQAMETYRNPEPKRIIDRWLILLKISELVKRAECLESHKEILRTEDVQLV